LPGDLQESNLAQADDIAAKLARTGCTVTTAEAPGQPAALSDEEVELLAEAEHGRWNAGRLLTGWTWAERRDVNS
jgi:predicted AAA+ superfamily ATPase